MQQIIKWKTAIKKNPYLPLIAYFISPPLVSNNVRNRLIADTEIKGLILNIGSGGKNFGGKCINLDIECFPNVDIVSDAGRLPFKDEKFDLVLIENVIEHIFNINDVISEIKRILKDRGKVYATVPFIRSYHGNPQDYWRFTVIGFGQLWCKFGFSEIRCATHGGPTSALLSILRDYLAMLFSFGNESLYFIHSQALNVVFFPLKYIDLFFLKNRNAHNLAYSVLYVGQK